MYKCSVCNLTVIVIPNVSLIRPCKCKVNSRKRTLWEKIRMFFNLKVENILVDAPIKAECKATVYSHSKFGQSK